MNEKEFRDLYEQRGHDAEDTDRAVSAVREMGEFLLQKDTSFKDCPLDTLREYLDLLMENGENTIPVLLALARYCYLVNNHEAYIYFTKLFGGMGVMENIRKKLEFHAGRETADAVFENLDAPPLGSPPDEIPEYTEKVISRLRSSLSPLMYRKVLAGNNHGIPEESMLGEKKLYQESGSLDKYLKERHERKVAELQQYCDEGKVWFEQQISQEIVDYVKGNQEILSAVREGNRLYVTKIPFDGIGFLGTDDPVLKSYYACHCPFARERIMDETKGNVDADWCYCSAGFAKFPFEVIFGEELEVEVLDSALKGSPVCRFAITLPEGIK